MAYSHYVLAYVLRHDTGCLNRWFTLQEVEHQLQQQGKEPLQRFVYQLYKLLLESGKLIPCREDTTLAAGDVLPSWPATNSSSSSSSRSSSSSPKYFFASNLRDNSEQMPHFTLSLLQTLLRLPREAAFVSIYESNSNDDKMHGWIDVIQLALNVIGTPHRLIAHGMFVRREGQHR
jgi:hypothetical protein